MLIGYIPLNTDSEDEPLWERKLLQCFTCKLSIYTWQHSIRTFVRIMYLSVDALFHSLRFLQRRSLLHWNFLVLKMDSSVWKLNGLITGLIDREYVTNNHGYVPLRILTILFRDLSLYFNKSYTHVSLVEQKQLTNPEYPSSYPVFSVIHFIQLRIQ